MTVLLTFCNLTKLSKYSKSKKKENKTVSLTGLNLVSSLLNMISFNDKVKMIELTIEKDRLTAHLKPAVYYVLFHSILAFLLKINLMFTPLSIFLFNRSLLTL